MKTTIMVIMKLLGGPWMLVLIACYIVFSRTFIPVEILKFSNTLAVIFFLAYIFIFVHKIYREARENELRPVSEMTSKLLSKEAREKTRQLVRGEARKAGFYRKRLSGMFNFIELYKDKVKREVDNYKEQASKKDKQAHEIFMMCSKMRIARY